MMNENEMELLRMIRESDNPKQALMEAVGEPTPWKMVRLASYMFVLEHLFGARERPTPVYSTGQDERTETIYTSGGTDFLRALNGKPPEKVMVIVDELAETVKAIHPKAYESVMRKIKEL